MMEQIKKYGIWVLLLGVIVYFFYTSRADSYGLQAGEPAPDFHFTALNGKEYNLDSFKGQYVLIDFWGSWCFPCRAANAKLRNMYHEIQANKDYRNNFSLVSIAYEKDSTAWLNVIKQQQLFWPIHVMEKQIEGYHPVLNKFEVKAFPTNFLINPDGRIVGVNVSPTNVILRLKEM